MRGICASTRTSMPPTRLTTSCERLGSMTKTREKKPTVLLELRPALDGYAGIPQETRLLFRGLRMVTSLDVGGMLQTSGRILAKRTSERGLLSFRRLSEAKRINRYSRVVISAAERPFSVVLNRI